MDKAKPVPTSRLSRLGKFGLLASKIAGNMLADGSKALVQGKRPQKQSLLLSPKNIESLVEQLAELRGAAMKLGQLLSMDSGEVLPPELSRLFARLRAEGHAMPHKQLIEVLKSNWGDNWLDSFSHFDLRPFAAASIGQVHKATFENGLPLAVKIQYPGIAKSIQSDVDNLASLVKATGLVPKHVDFDPLINEAKQQLLIEADYRQEAAHLIHYKTQLDQFSQYKIPSLISELSTESILVMEFVNGDNLEACVALPQTQRNKLVSDLIYLFFLELFDFKLVQTDPNLANYQYQPESCTLVLFDFGAARVISDEVCTGYATLFAGAMNRDSELISQAAFDIGYFNADISPVYQQKIIEIFMLACEPLQQDQEYDFATSSLAAQIKEIGLDLSSDKHQWHSPPVDALFLHRKLAGLYLIAAKLKAQVNVRRLYHTFLTSKKVPEN